MQCSLCRSPCPYPLWAPDGFRVFFAQPGWHRRCCRMVWKWPTSLPLDSEPICGAPSIATSSCNLRLLRNRMASWLSHVNHSISFSSFGHVTVSDAFVLSAPAPDGFDFGAWVLLSHFHWMDPSIFCIIKVFVFPVYCTCRNRGSILCVVPVYYNPRSKYFWRSFFLVTAIMLYYESQLSSLAEVAHCERSENRGSGGRSYRNGSFWGKSPPNSGGHGGRFWGWCTRWQLGDGGVRFPPGPSMDVHWGEGQNIRKKWKN